MSHTVLALSLCNAFDHGSLVEACQIAMKFEILELEGDGQSLFLSFFFRKCIQWYTVLSDEITCWNIPTGSCPKPVFALV